MDEKDLDSTYGISPDAFETVEERPCIGKKRPKTKRYQQRGRKCTDEINNPIAVENQVQIEEPSSREDKGNSIVKNSSSSNLPETDALPSVKEEPRSDEEYPQSNFPTFQTSDVETYWVKTKTEEVDKSPVEAPSIQPFTERDSSKVIENEETTKQGDSIEEGTEKVYGPVRPVTTSPPQLKILLEVDEMKRKFSDVITCDDTPQQEEKKCSRETSKEESFVTEEEDLGYVGVPSPASTLGPVEENQMDIELNVDDILDNLPNLPEDDTLSPEWSQYVQSLTETIKTVASSLQDEREINERQAAEIATLKEELSKQKHELETCKKWQSTVYVEMEKSLMQYQQYCQSITMPYMYFGYPGYPQYMPGSTPSYPSMYASAPPPPFPTPDTVVKESAAVPYGDSSKSKKLSERKRYRPKTHFSTPIVNTCVQSVPISVDTVATKDTTQTNPPATEDSVKTEVTKKTNMETENSINEEEVPKKETSTEDSDSLSSAGKSIEETLREAAESVVSTTGFQYDESSGQYYDWNLKMYYDPSSGLYFDHENGIYYYYDNDKKSYIFHSQVKVDNTEKKDDKPKVRNYDSEPSDGEIISDEEETTKEVTTQIAPTEPSVPIDPCIRVIVVQSDSLELGSLFVLTCTGATIGRDPSCTICIPEDRVSRIHNYIMYDVYDKTYFIQDNITPNGTFLNSERLSESKVPSEPYEITHRDLIKVGDTMLSFHVHCQETCHDCEPGNIQAIIARESQYNGFSTREEMSEERKRQAKNMRKKYGLNPGYIPKGLIESIPDRAGQRRKEHGIEAYENKDLPVTKASVVREIPSDNKGHQMLAKMGWKSGEGLGKSKSGIVNPVTVDKLSNPIQGLGGSKKTSMDQVGNKKAQNWEKARQRYDMCR